MPSPHTTEPITPILQPLEFILDDIVLGSGTFSVVRLAQNTTTKEYVAAKILNLQKNRQYYDKEVHALTTIPPHQNIVPLVQFGEDFNTGYIFTQYYVQSITLFDFVKGCGGGGGGGGGLCEFESLGILDQLVDGLRAIHAAKFSHNDLKPDNVLYNPLTKVVQIFDFGLSLEVTEEVESECCGSPLYMAPEVLTRSPRHNPMLSDIWSLGLIFYFLLVGDLPWRVETLQDLIKAVLGGRLYTPKHMSRSTRELLAGMLQLNPNSRWTLHRIKRHVQDMLASTLKQIKI